MKSVLASWKIYFLTNIQKPTRICFVRFDQNLSLFIMTTKTKFITVKPISNKAKNRFANEMDLLHSCKIEQETETQWFLSSISGRYFFWMDKNMDNNWMVI